MIEFFNGWMVYHSGKIKLKQEQLNLIPSGIIFANMAIFGSFFRVYIRLTGDYVRVIDIRPTVAHYLGHLNYLTIFFGTILLLVLYFVGVYFILKRLLHFIRIGGEAGATLHLLLI
jgi:hypothetical protein